MPAYRNIDTLLKDRKVSTLIIGSGSVIVDMSDRPKVGEEVGLSTTFDQNLQAIIHAFINGHNSYQGTAKHDVYEGEIGNMERVIAAGELIEFSHSKVHAVSRG